MRKACFAVLLLLIVLATTAGAPVYRGEAIDPQYPCLGVISYFGWPGGLQLWHTVTESWFFYEAGHSYHHVCLVDVRNPDEWCTTAVMPDREPISLTGHAGETMTCRIWDTTMDVEVCPYP
jgi:hypothetical protein